MFTPKSNLGHPSSASGRALASGNRRRSSMGVGGTPYSSRNIGGARSPYTTPLNNRLANAANLSKLNSPSTPSMLGQQNQLTVESCGSSLPALVMEALTFSDRNSEMSAVLSASGWSWLVTGRRLLVWRFIKDVHNVTGTPLSRSRADALRPQFRELLLPQSDLAHRAQLVVLRQQDSSQAPSCLAVSPEGAVRYWPSITDENTYTEISTDLQGQECETLVYLSSNLGYFLATTTSTTLLIQPNYSVQPGDTSISVRQVKVPAGLLGGLSRKVTSLMFGSMPTQAPEARLVRVVSRSSSSGAISVLVLSAEHLQCWHLSSTQSDTLQYEAPLLHLCQTALMEKLQASVLSPEAHNKKLHIWLLDMQARPSQTNKIITLVAAIHPIRNDLILALASFDSSSEPDSVSQLTILQHSESLDSPFNPNVSSHDSPPPQLLHYRLLLTQSTAYVHHRRAVMSVALSDATLAMLQSVPFNGAGEMIIGSGKISDRPLFFSSTQGIVTVGSAANALNNTSIMETTIAQESPSRALSSSLYLDSEGLESLAAADSSPASKLSAAFMYYNKRDFVTCERLLEELFPSGDYSRLSSASLQLSLNLLDDTPATDPRWAELTGGGASGGSVGAPLSLIIANQIRDKSTAHSFYISFLHRKSLWSHITNCEGVSVKLALLEHSQKLAFANALRNQQLTQNHLQLLIDQAISEVVKHRDESISGRLTSADLFYCKVSQVQQIIWGLMQSVNEIITADVVPRDASASLHVTSSLVLTLLKTATSNTTSVCDNQQTSGGSMTSLYLGGDSREYVPWTATEGPMGVRTLLISLHKALVETALPRAEDAPTKCKLYGVMVELTDLILSGYQPQLASLSQGSRFDLSGVNAGTPGYKFRDGLVHSVSTGAAFVPETAVPVNHQRYQHLLSLYQKLRYGLLQPLVSGDQLSQALSLGEKYCDFRTLVEVCDKTDDTARLDKYMHQFSQQGFSDFVFRWHMESGKRGRLLSYSGDTLEARGASQWAGDLGKFLKGYSGLEWVHQLNSRNFSAAEAILKEQGLQETTYLSRKKTLLSLSKLCKIADGQQLVSEETADLDDTKMDTPDALQMEDDLILYQEQLPEEVLALNNLEVDNMRVLSPSEMIELYTCDENRAATELDFKKALDLLSFIPSEDEVGALKGRIWARAVLRDQWMSLPTDSPMEAISNTVLFRTIELAFTQGCSLKDLLISVEELLQCEELSELGKDTGFNFLIRAGYEQVQQYIC